MTKSKLKILFLCTGNSCRSQMAEGWARHLQGDRIEAYSAGIKTHGLNPNAVKVMAEAGVDLSRHHSKRVDDLQGVTFDYVVTVCDHAHESCPLFPGKTKVVHVGFDDPPRLAKSAKSEDEALGHYRRVRDEIQAFVADIFNRLPDVATRSVQPPESEAKPKVLFVCRHNTCRSQMAEALLRHAAGDRFDIYSCGLEARPVHRLTVAVMQEIGLDISRQQSKDCGKYLGRLSVNYAIFVCNVTEEQCPKLYPFAMQHLRWPFQDPTTVSGTEAERLAVFRRVRDEIREQIREWLVTVPAG